MVPLRGVDCVARSTLYKILVKRPCAQTKDNGDQWQEIDNRQRLNSIESVWAHKLANWQGENFWQGQPLSILETEIYFWRLSKSLVLQVIAKATSKHPWGWNFSWLPKQEPSAVDNCKSWSCKGQSWSISYNTYESYCPYFQDSHWRKQYPNDPMVKINANEQTKLVWEYVYISLSMEISWWEWNETKISKVINLFS